MALSVKVGNFTQPTATNASFAVTGVGFVPKALILFATDETGVGISTTAVNYMGMATSASNRYAISAAHLSAVNTRALGHDNTKCFLVVNTSATTLVAADLVSFDSDGFTLNFSTVDLVGRIIGYIALGGADLTNAFVKVFQPGASTGSESQTGVGFKPDAAIIIGSGNGNAPPSNITNASNVNISFIDTALNQESMYINNSTATESVQKAKAIEHTSGGGAITFEANMTSWDTDGFTYNITTNTSNKYFGALCLKGGQYNVGVFNQATSTGNQAAVTGQAFQPTGVLLGSWNLAASTSINTSTARLSFGAASGSTNRASMWMGGGNTAVSDNDIDTAKIINMITEGASPTTNASADFVSMDSGGFTINNTSADATTREVAYMMMGSNAVAPVNLGTSRLLTGVGK